jgi:adenine phosphoribosyltransferase
LHADYSITPGYSITPDFAITADTILAALRQVIADFDNRPTHSVVGKGGQTFAFFPTAITDNIPPLRPELSAAVRLLSQLHLECLHETTLGVGEEDRGAMIISDILLHYNLPRTLARWTPTGAPGEVAVPLANEYVQEGDMQVFLNGVQPGDRVLLVDDLISTGGTMVALIHAVQKAGAEILEIFTIGEKAENRGRSHIHRETGLSLKTLLVSELEARDGQFFSKVVHCNLGNLDPQIFKTVAAEFPLGFCRLGSGD